MMLYPELGAYEKWSLKATEIQNTAIKNHIVNALGDEATFSDRTIELDIADQTQFSR